MEICWIPINATLLEGHDYDLEVSIPEYAGFSYIDEDTVTMSFLAGDAVVVRDAEEGGDAAWTDQLCHFSLRFNEGAGGVTFNLAKPGGPPPPENFETVSMLQGMYVTALVDEELYAVDLMADVDIGNDITARIYEATGTTRGALIAQGSIKSNAEGYRWHTIPISTSLLAARDYDIEIDVPMLHKWRYWSDTTGLPYEPYGVVRVNDGEHGGDPGDTHLIELRLRACDALLTAVTEPVQPPKFYLSRPYPNPTPHRSTIRFSLDEAGPVSIAVYNVRGQRVATLVNDEKRLPGPGSVSLDAGRLASGIYFVKMSTPTKSVSRKIAVVR
jgi:hypothetical protein